MIIGITGIFGSGKTTVAKMFAKHNYLHINADEVGHRLLENKTIKEKIIKIFEKSILTKGRIDRRKLKDIVFNDSNKLKGLNQIIHPAIINEIKSIIQKNKNKKIVVDGALLIEVGCLDLFDKLIVVKIDEKEQIKRVLAKEKYNLQEIQNILKSQLPQKEKLKYADIVIDNSKDLKTTKKQVDEVLKKLQ